MFCGCDNKEENILNVLNWSSYIPESVIKDFTNELKLTMEHIHQMKSYLLRFLLLILELMI